MEQLLDQRMINLWFILSGLVNRGEVYRKELHQNSLDALQKKNARGAMNSQAYFYKVIREAQGSGWVTIDGGGVVAITEQGEKRLLDLRKEYVPGLIDIEQVLKAMQEDLNYRQFLNRTLSVDDVRGRFMSKLINAREWVTFLLFAMSEGNTTGVHGHAIVKRMQRCYGWTVSNHYVYEILRDLEKEKEWLVSDWKSGETIRRRKYWLTEKGELNQDITEQHLQEGLHQALAFVDILIQKGRM